jgi:hypothetical protein
MSCSSPVASLAVLRRYGGRLPRDDDFDSCNRVGFDGAQHGRSLVLFGVCLEDLHGRRPATGCDCRLALPRVSIQPGVAYGDLHFPGCPFSPGLLLDGVTTGGITAVAVAEHAYGALALADVGYHLRLRRGTLRNIASGRPGRRRAPAHLGGPRGAATPRIRGWMKWFGRCESDFKVYHISNQNGSHDLSMPARHTRGRKWFGS